MKRNKALELAEKVVSIGSDVADVIVHLKKPSTVGIMAVAARALNSYKNVTKVSIDHRFNSWTNFEPAKPLWDALAGTLVDQHMCHDIIEADNERGKSIIAKFPKGSMLGWLDYGNWNVGPWIPPDQTPDDTISEIASLFWGTYGNSVELRTSGLGTLSVAADILNKFHPSKTATDIAETVMKYVNAGHKRSVLLYGPSGTGKSNIARNIADRCGGKTVRIEAAVLASLSNLPQVLELLRPDALIIDDIDTVEKPHLILGKAEQIHEMCNLFLATANNLNMMCKAMLRPGRFDERIHVEKLDDEVLDSILATFPEQVVPTLREMPIAYIDAFRLALEVEGLEPSLAKLKELEERHRQFTAEQIDKEEEAPVVKED